MAGVNKVILLGNLGVDPEVRYLENGSVVARVRLATSEYYKDREGNRIENTEWHDIEMWEGLAKVTEQYLRQGDTIYVEGKLKANTWQDKDGNNRKTIRVRATTMNIVKRANPEGEIRPLNTQPATATAAASPQASYNNSKSAPDPISHAGSDNEIDDLPF